MTKFAIISTLLFLTLCAGCTTTSPRVVVQTEILKSSVPDALLQPCPKPWHKAGGPRTTEDFVNRGDVNEAALASCAAKVDGIRKWNSQ